jgi:hypothetical protein
MNMLSVIQSELSPQAIGHISNTIGESPQSTNAALGTAIPAVLGSLIAKVNASPDGATQILDVLKGDQSGWMNSISALQTGSAANQTESGMGSLLNSVMGPKLGPISEFISGRCGIRSSSATSILGAAAAWVMGTLSKHVSSQGLEAVGLARLLSSQADNLKPVLPAELANTIGIGSFLSGANETTRVPTETAAQPRQAYASAPAPTVSVMRGSALKWAVPLLIVAAVALFAVSHTSEKDSVGGSGDPMQTQAGRITSMPDFSNLNLPPGSLSDRIAKAASSGPSNQKFEMQGLVFDSTGSLTPSANTQLQYLASVLKAAPSLNLGVTCFGSTTDAGKQKADSIKSVLTSSGVLPERVLTRGESGSGIPTLRLIK